MAIALCDINLLKIAGQKEIIPLIINDNGKKKSYLYKDNKPTPIQPEARKEKQMANKKHLTEKNLCHKT